MEGSPNSNLSQPNFVDLESPTSQNVGLWNLNQIPFLPLGSMPMFIGWQALPDFPHSMPLVYHRVPVVIPSGLSNASLEKQIVTLMEIKVEEAENNN